MKLLALLFYAAICSGQVFATDCNDNDDVTKQADSTAKEDGSLNCEDLAGDWKTLCNGIKKFAPCDERKKLQAALKNLRNETARNLELHVIEITSHIETIKVAQLSIKFAVQLLDQQKNEVFRAKENLENLKVYMREIQSSRGNIALKKESLSMYTQFENELKNYTDRIANFSLQWNANLASHEMTIIEETHENLMILEKLLKSSISNPSIGRENSPVLAEIYITNHTRNQNLVNLLDKRQKYHDKMAQKPENWEAELKRTIIDLELKLRAAENNSSSLNLTLCNELHQDCKKAVVVASERNRNWELQLNSARERESALTASFREVNSQLISKKSNLISCNLLHQDCEEKFLEASKQNQNLELQLNASREKQSATAASLREVNSQLVSKESKLISCDQLHQDCEERVLEASEQHQNLEIQLNNAKEKESESIASLREANSELDSKVLKLFLSDQKHQDCEKRVETILEAIGRVTLSTGTYVYNKEKLSWSSAKKYCENLGMGLVAIETEAENKEIINLARRASPSECFWTSGCYSRRNSAVVWRSTGRKFTYTNWYGNHGNSRDMSNCVEVDPGDETWMEASTDEKQPSICEIM